MKTIITVTGIRPDFIRMSEIFKKLDENFNHILIHSGQHYNTLLSDIFFKELEIRKPDYNLRIGGPGKEHFHQTAELPIKLIELIRSEKLNPDLILFLGDSNSVASSFSLKKEGYKIGHIEAGMRSYSKYMPEEINRIVCDACTDYFFVYHENYKNNLLKENHDEENIFVVGNTLVEPVQKCFGRLKNKIKRKDFILMDIHRHNNIINIERLKNIIKYGNECYKKYNIPVKILNFERTIKVLNENNISFGNIELIPLMSFKDYLDAQYHCKFLISDSGSAPEECSILKTKVICPRNESERWESIYSNTCFMLDVDNNINFHESFNWIQKDSKIYSKWLGDGNTSTRIIDILKTILNNHDEIWKSINDYPSYEISNKGRVRSINRLDCIGNYRTGGIIKQKYQNNGYKSVTLAINGASKRKTITVHRLVAKAFIPKIKDKNIVHHIDHDKTNNILDNLQWVNNSENIRYAYKAGRIIKKYGIDANRTKLTKEDILEIKKMRFEDGLSLKEIADLYNISFGHVSGVCLGNKRKNLHQEQL